MSHTENVDEMVVPETSVPETSVPELVHEEISMPSYFPEILDKGTESHIMWLLIKNLMHYSVHRLGAVIFGGAVRDSILHGYASREF